MAHLHKKMKKGRPYYYVREIARVEGEPKVINQVYLGSPDRIMEMASSRVDAKPHKIQAKEFGALWLANLVESEIGIAELIDEVAPREEKEEGPSVGEYFLYAIYNRMVDACSKRAMPEWYRSTAIQFIRPVDVEALTSQLFWKKWHRVSKKQLERIATEFLRRLSKLEPSASDCFMFDTTNYFTFMASDTPSDLAMRGKNKEGRNWLRQIGVALLVSRDNRLPLFYKEYEGNRHDSKVFHEVIKEVFMAMRDLVGDKARMTVVFDKGMNSDENIAKIDAQENINFVTTYSTYYAEDLIHVKLDKFEPVDTSKNRELFEVDRAHDRLIAWRSQGEYWGKERTVVVTYNPLTASKQRYNFEKKMFRLQEILYEFQAKVNRNAPYWRKKDTVLHRYQDSCAELHIPSDLYNVEGYNHEGNLRMNFRKNNYRIGRYIDRFGKNIIVTDNDDWTTDEIVNASLDRWTVEDGFRQSKDDDLVAMMPIRHFTDSKIRCHIFTCIAALGLLRLIEIRIREAGLKLTAKAAMKKMHSLHSCLTWIPGKKKPERILEDPDSDQAKILKAFGRGIKSGVMQEQNSQQTSMT
jgi:transposase